MKVKVVLNPYAKRWTAKAKQAEVRAALDRQGLSYDLVATAGPQEGIQLAAEAAAGDYDAVVAAGGDGTINEVVNGVLQVAGDKPTLPFGIIPIGTANDFSLMAGIPIDIEESVKVIAAGHTRQIDAGVVNGRFFINNSAVAMEPMVTLENIRMKRLSGEVRYLVALVKAIVKLKAWDMDIKWDGGGYQGPTYLLSVCNSPRTGGFTMAPGARIDDGEFDLVFAPEVSKATVVNVLLGLLRGTHVSHPAVMFQRTRQLTLTSTPGTPVHADGEVFTESATAVTYHILPGKVTLLSPTG